MRGGRGGFKLRGLQDDIVCRAKRDVHAPVAHFSIVIRGYPEIYCRLAMRTIPFQQIRKGLCEVVSHGNSYAEMLSQYDLLSNSLFRPVAQKSSLDKLEPMKGHEFERILVETMVDIAERKGFKHQPLAIAAWKDKKDPGTKWRKIRNGTEPRGFQIDDAYDLALAMGVSFVELCGMAQGRLMQANPVQPQAEAVPLKNAESEVETSASIRSNVTASKQGDGIQSIMGGPSESC